MWYVVSYKRKVGMQGVITVINDVEINNAFLQSARDV